MKKIILIIAIVCSTIYAHDCNCTEKSPMIEQNSTTIPKKITDNNKVLIPLGEPDKYDDEDIDGLTSADMWERATPPTKNIYQQPKVIQPIVNEKNITKTIKKEPTIKDINKTKSLMVQGVDAYKDGKYSDAIKLLNKSLKEDPNNHVTYFILALAYDEKGNITHEMNDIHKAYSYVQKSIEIKEENTSLEVLEYFKQKIKTFTPKEEKEPEQKVYKKCDTCPLGSLMK